MNKRAPDAMGIKKLAADIGITLTCRPCGCINAKRNREFERCRRLLARRTSRLYSLTENVKSEVFEKHRTDTSAALGVVKKKRGVGKTRQIDARELWLRTNIDDVTLLGL